MPDVKDFKDPDVWKAARELVKETYIICQTLPKQELYALFDQMRRAAISIPSNIAEGWGRSGANDYPHFLSIALGSTYELQTQLILCKDPELAEGEKIEHEVILCERIAMMLNRMISILNR